MNSYLLFTVTGPKVILVSYDSLEHPEVLKKLKTKGISKFIVYEVSIESTRAKYGKVFNSVHDELYENDDLRIVDCSRDSSSEKFSFNELSNPTFYEPKRVNTVDFYMVGV
jgi:hypothetical protein